MDTVDLSVLDAIPGEAGTSRALVRGIAARFSGLGYRIGGFDAYTVSDVLKGSGLSSSAAFEVAVGTMLNHLYNDGRMDCVCVAQVGQYAENRYFEKPSGLMDQMASSVGGFVEIDFADPEKPVIESVNFAFEDCGYSLCIVDTKGSHSDLTPDYAGIPSEMGAVAKFFGKNYLREVDEAAFYKELPRIRVAAGDRAVLRAIHFFADDAQVPREVKALGNGDFEAFRKLVLESGDSSFYCLQNVFSTSHPQEQGLTLALALSRRILGDKGAWRVHGGGFAGTIQAFVPDELLANYKEKMEEVFGAGACYVLSIRPIGGLRFTEEGEAAANGRA